MGKRSRQKWKVADIFLVPLKDGTFCPGQVVGREADVLNSVSIALAETRVREAEDARDMALDDADIFAILFATRDLLDSGRWKVVGSAAIAIRSDEMPYEGLRSTGFVGAKVRGSAIIEEFASAFFGLCPWDDWKDPHYLDGLLRSPDKKPMQRLVLGKPA